MTKSLKESQSFDIVSGKEFGRKTAVPDIQHVDSRHEWRYSSRRQSDERVSRCLFHPEHV